MRSKQLDAELKAQGKSRSTITAGTFTRRSGCEYQTNEELKAKRAEVLHLIEEGNNPTAELADYVATRNVECILDTMERLSIRYDLLPRESEILHLHFWDKAFEQMKQLGVIHYVDEGKHAGCWVMPFEEHTGHGRARERQDPRPLERHRHLHRQGHRLPDVEARHSRARFQLPEVSQVSRTARKFG